MPGKETIRLLLLLAALIAVILLTYPSIASAVLTLCLILALPIYFWQKFLNK